MESFEYYRARAVYSPQPASPAREPAAPPGQQAARARGDAAAVWPPLLEFNPAGPSSASINAAAWDSGFGDGCSGEGQQQEEEGWCDSPGSDGGRGYEVALAGELDTLHAAAAITHAGWLLKAGGKGPRRAWRRHWVYLRGDRLCFTTDPGGTQGVRYIPLDRIPVRALPRGYGPKIGVTVVDSRQLDTSAPAMRGRRAGCIFSLAAGSHTHFWAAETPEAAKTWVEHITQAWVQCVKHVARGSHQPSAEEVLAMREARWRAENETLRRSLADAERRQAVDSQQQQQQQQQRQQGPIAYEVQVVTGDYKGAGTSSKVYIEVFGVEEGRRSGEHQLVFRDGSPARPFQPGATDGFKLQCHDLGELSKVRVYHDSSGPSPSWFLEEVRIRPAGGSGAGGWTVFPCRRWLAVDQDDGRVMRDLRPGALPSLATYRVATVTSNLRGADTDANVFITLHGRQGDGGRHALASGPRDFERGATNEFVVQDSGLGELEAVTIGHDGSGQRPAWHLQQVTVIDTSSGREYTFPCRQWFDAVTGDGRTERRLQLSRGVPEPCWYTVVVCTSDLRGAGTTSEVFLSLHGSEGSSPRVKLPSQAGDFERGQEDVFRVQLPRMGRLERLTVGQNCTGASAEWHLEQVEVTDEGTGETVFFQCNSWLSGTKGDCLAERTLLASAANPRDRLASYRLELHTSDLRAAGTSAAVWVELHGAGGSSSVQRLQSTPKSFARGAVDAFSFTCAHLGELRKLTVGHDGTGDSPSWHLHKVVVTCLKTGAVTEFPCGRWLAAGEDDGCTTRDLYPNSAPARLTQYTLTVHTSDLRGAGTTAKVYVELPGRLHTVGPLQLDNNPANFERGRADVFQLTERDVGEVERLRIWHDGSGAAPSWHLHFVELAVGGGSAGAEQPLYFNCGDWLASPSCERVLLPSLTDPRSSMTTYAVMLWTSDIKGAGTDSNLSCVLHGSLGSSPVLPLAGGAGCFERGKVDEFSFALPSLGQLRRLTLASDGSGRGGGWHCEMASVHNTRSGEIVYFLCDRWLDTTHGLQADLEASPHNPRLDYRQYRLLVSTAAAKGSRRGDGDVHVELVGSAGSSGWRRVPAGGQGMSQVEEQIRGLGPLQQARVRVEAQTYVEALEVIETTSGDRWRLPCYAWLSERAGADATLPAFRAGDMVGYTLRLHTSDIPGAGTDSRVFFELAGRGGATTRLWLGPAASGLGPGQVAELAFDWASLGELQQLLVGQDGSGAAPGWHLDYAEVVSGATGQVAYFDCNRWLSKGHGDGCLEHTFAVSSADPSFSRCTYQLSVHTSSTRAAGLPDGLAVSLVLAGSKGSLPRSEIKRAGTFARSQQDDFQLVGPDVGAFDHLSIRVEDPAGRAAWHLSHVEAHNLKTGERALFVCRDWVHSDGVELTAADSSALDDVEYEVVVHTSDVRAAGTDADVLLELHGARGDSGTLQLPSGVASFRRGAADTFHVLAPDVGEPQELVVWHTGKRQEDAWHLDFVEVTNRASGTTSFFVCRGWVGQGERKVLAASARDPKLDQTTYKVVVHTSDTKGAGTDVSVFLELRGERHSSGPVPLGSGAEAAFERGQADAFTLRLPHLGELHEAVVGHDGKGQRPSWHLDYLEVTEVQSGRVCYFVCRDWLSASKGDGATQRTLKAQPDDPRSALAKYRIRVTTSDLRGAGTDAVVLVQLFGQGGQSERVALVGEEGGFARGQTSEFGITAPRLGPLRKLWIGHDNKGGNAAWHLKEVSVLDTAMGEQSLFECSAWIEGDALPVGVELFPSTGGAPSQARLAQYEVVIKTGDERGADTDADVSINLTGSSGTSGQQKLAAGAGAFKRGGTDCFALQLPPLGDLQRLEISRTAQGQQQGWLLESVKVIDRSGGGDQEYNFFAHCWLDEAHGLAAVLQPGRGKQYKVFVHTSNLADAGTDCGVSICLHGAAGSTGPRALSSGKATFDRGSSNEFLLEAQDVGELQRVTLSLDCQGSRKSWHCACVEVGCTQDGGVITFPCGMWLSRDRSDGLVQWELYPEGSPLAAAQVAYKICIHTSADVPAAGTSRGVGLELHGAHNVAGPVLLANEGGAYFGQGSVDTFRVEALDVGELQQLRIWVDAPEEDPAASRWFCDLVSVTSEASGRTAYFACRKWLERRNGFEALLAASSADPARQEVDYKVCVFTSAFLGAETGGGVIMDIGGERGRSGVLTLRNKAGLSFRAGQRDEFHVHLPSLGALTDLRVGHDGPRDWHLDKIEVTDTAAATTFYFPCEKWVQSSGSGGTLGTQIKLKAYTTDPASLPVQYSCKVTVEEVAGTVGRDQLSLQLFGTRCETGPQALDISKFVRTGKKEIVTSFEAPNVGQMEKLRVGLNDRGQECAVLLSSVEVVNQSSGERAVFACSEWLSTKDDYDLELAAGEEPAEVSCSYRVEVQTSDLRRAGTTGHAYLTVVGERERIGPYKLSNHSGDHFQRGQLDVFQISVAPDIGQLRQIEVRHDGQGKKNGWHLAWIKVANETTGAVALFKCDRFIDKQTGDPQVVAVVMPLPPPSLQPHQQQQQQLASRFALKERQQGMAAPAAHSARLHQAGPEAVEGGAPTERQPGYKVSFHTSRGCGAGTNAKVFFELVGDRDSSGVVMPVAARRSFKPGRVDVFTYHDMPWVGELQAVRVGTDGSGFFPGWHLRQVEVVHLPTNTRRCFACYQWIDKKSNYFRWLHLDEPAGAGKAAATAPGKLVPSPGAPQRQQQQQQGAAALRSALKAPGGSPSPSPRPAGAAMASPPQGSPGARPGTARSPGRQVGFEEVMSPMIGARW